ncbi:MAG: hypothetical protein IPM45_02540 [Acidimicrobiales bacterium]|nr:hypothetical protein [Acidimicrobiales bacterium]
MSTEPTPAADLERIVESARRLGVELDEADALQWLGAIVAARESSGVVVHAETGVFGHQVSMLDFSPDDLAHFRAVGRLVGFDDAEGVETALALSGSAAQSKIQTYPGDCDYFERVNILAPTRDDACRRLAALIRDKAMATLEGDTYRLLEVKFGSYPQDVERQGRLCRAGTPIAWMPAEIGAGSIVGRTPGGEPVEIGWDQVAPDPGWCKLDWVVADPVRNQVANASNMLDVTWEAPDGSITPLDGYLDPYFQEVYLEADSVPVFSKLVEHVSPDALEEYVARLEEEVRKYVAHDPRNYGKAAKRMYNVFRLSGRYEEAAFLRELFDEPTAVLYQVHAVIRTVDEASVPGSSITTDTVLAQVDALVVDVLRALDGVEEEEIVRQLLRLRDAVGRQSAADTRSAAVAAARDQVMNLVNNFFHDKLTGLPSIAAYLDEMAAAD